MTLTFPPCGDHVTLCTQTMQREWREFIYADAHLLPQDVYLELFARN